MATVNYFKGMYINRLKKGHYRLYGKKMIKTERVESDFPGESDLKETVRKYKVDIPVDEMDLPKNDYERNQHLRSCIETAAGDKVDNLKKLITVTHISDTLMEVVDERRDMMCREITDFLEVVASKDVNFVRIQDRFGWYVDINENRHGTFTKTDTGLDTDDCMKIWQTARYNAKELIKEKT